MNCDYAALKDVELPPIVPLQPASPVIQNWGNCIQGHTFRYVRGTELARCQSVNKQWQLALNSDAFASIWTETFHSFAPIWKEAYHSDFCLPESPPQQKSYQVLYKEKICTRLNIRYRQPEYTPINRDDGSSVILVNDHLIQAFFGEITLYRIAPYELEQTIRTFPLSASPNMMDKQKKGIIDSRLDKHFVGYNLELSRACRDLFFSRSRSNMGSIVCLWEASTGNCLFANDNISSSFDDDLQLVADQVIYTTNRQQWANSNHKLCEVQVWDYKSQQLIGAFNLPAVNEYYYYRHHLRGKVLVSECRECIIGHHLETQEKLYSFSHHTHMQMIATDTRLLIYDRYERIRIYGIREGSLILELKSGFLAFDDSKKFQCYKNYCLIQAGDYGLQVCDLDKGVQIKNLKPVFPSNQVNLACPFIIHHDRLIVHYTYYDKGSVRGYLVVWNLKDFSVLISIGLGCEVGSLNFMDDHLLALDVSNQEKRLVRILFWDILEGNFLGYSSKNVSPTKYGVPYQIDFLNGKMFIKNQREHTVQYSNRTETTLYGGIYDFSVDFKPKPTLGQKILKAVRSVFCS